MNKFDIDEVRRILENLGFSFFDSSDGLKMHKILRENGKCVYMIKGFMEEAFHFHISNSSNSRIPVRLDFLLLLQDTDFHSIDLLGKTTGTVKSKRDIENLLNALIDTAYSRMEKIFSTIAEIKMLGA